MEENTVKNSTSSAISYNVFFGTIGIVLLNLLSVVFPALLVSTFGSHAEFLSPFEIGYQGIPLIIINIALFGLGILYYKKRSSSFHNGINKIRSFEISKKVTLIVGIIILAVYIGITVPELINKNGVVCTKKIDNYEEVMGINNIEQLESFEE